MSENRVLFRYRRHYGRWHSAIYYVQPPKVPAHETPFYGPLIDVTHLQDESGNINLDDCRAAYPPPEEKETEHASL